VCMAEERVGDSSMSCVVFGPLTGRGMVPLTSNRPPHGPPQDPPDTKPSSHYLNSLFFPVSERTTPQVPRSNKIFSVAVSRT